MDKYLRAQYKQCRHHAPTVNQKYYKSASSYTINDSLNLLHQGADPNYQPEGSSVPPLLLAIQSKYPIKVNYLLELGANPNLAGPSGLTALESALHGASYSDPDCSDKRKMVKNLIQHGADVNAVSRHGDNMLMVALKEANYATIRHVLQAPRLKIDYRHPKTGAHALHIAVKQGQLRVVEYLLQNRRCNLEMTDNADLTPLHYAVKYDQPALVDYLLAQGANPQHRNKKGHAIWEYPKLSGPILDALRTNISEPTTVANLQQWLTQHTTYWQFRNNISAPSLVKVIDYPKGKRPLLIAIRNNDIVAVRELIAAGHPINESPEDIEPFRAATENNHVDMARFLVAQGANTRNRYFDPMKVAIGKGHYTMVKYLATELKHPLDHLPKPDKYAHVFSFDCYLWKAIDSNQYAILKLLIELGANKNLVKYERENPLQQALHKGALDMVELLIDQGAAYSIPGLPASRFMYSATQPACLEYILAHTPILKQHNEQTLADFSAKAIEAMPYYNPLLAAICQREAETLQRLIIALRPNINQRIGVNDEADYTLLLYTLKKYPYLDLVTTLLAAGADPTLTANEGKVSVWSLIDHPHAKYQGHWITWLLAGYAVSDKLELALPHIKKIGAGYRGFEAYQKDDESAFGCAIRKLKNSNYFKWNKTPIDAKNIIKAIQAEPGYQYALASLKKQQAILSAAAKPAVKLESKLRI